VAGDVDRVHGLAGARVAGVAALQFGVDRREGGADLLGDGLRDARRHPLLLALAHPAPLHVDPVHLAGNRTAGTARPEPHDPNRNRVFRDTESTIRRTKLSGDLSRGQHPMPRVPLPHLGMFTTFWHRLSRENPNTSHTTPEHESRRKPPAPPKELR